MEPETNVADAAVEVELTIERMAPGGWGIAHAGGRTYLVRGGISGERVRAVVSGERGRALQADVIEVMEASSDRVEPPRPLDEVPGGADFRHMSYEAQLRAKDEIVRDAFFRIGRIELDDDFTIIPSPSPLGYRMRATWHLDPMTGNFGYFARGSQTVIDVEHDPLLEPLLDEELRATRQAIRAGLTASLTYQAAAGDNAASAFGGIGEPMPLYRTVGRFKYRFDAATFFQANGLLLETMIDEALWLGRQIGADGEPSPPAPLPLRQERGERPSPLAPLPRRERGSGGFEGARAESVTTVALDLYAGVGFFSLPLSELFGRVEAIEADARAVRHAKRNASANGCRNVTVHGLETGRFFRDQKKAVGRAAFVLADPPRTGLDNATRDGIIAAGIPAFTYVSCDPATQARDLKVLLAAGYVIERVRGIDCFPQSHHVEVVAHLRRAG